MLFSTIQYLLFLPVVVALYWFLPKKARPVVLLIASYYFYMCWMPAYGLLLGGLTLWNFVIGLLLANDQIKNKRLLFIAGLAGNLACLCLYKYTNFLIQTFWSCAQSITHIVHVPTVHGEAPLLPIILPLGISFFVFEFIHYLTDVYRGTKAIANPIRFSLFAAFFPSQIAGPIKRFQDFDQQVLAEKHFDANLFRKGIYLILEGMFKKVVLADNLAQLVQAGFEGAAHLGTLDAWIAVAAFTLQIYYDFSGYTDIGRGSAMLLGYELPENFNMPYIARNLSEFWHRWHISLSTWLRDYLYIPMGGSKSGKWKQARNLLMTMLLGGLWHGADWHYVVWGGFHGLGLCATHTWQRTSEKIPFVKAVHQSFAWEMGGRIFTLFLVMLGWVVFRATDMGQACAVYFAMFTPKASTAPVASVTELLAQSTVTVAILLYAAFHSIRWAYRKWRDSHPAETAETTAVSSNWKTLRWWLTPPVTAQAIALLGLCLLIVGFAPQEAVPFIYFRF